MNSVLHREKGRFWIKLNGEQQKKISSGLNSLNKNAASTWQLTNETFYLEETTQ